MPINLPDDDDDDPELDPHEKHTPDLIEAFGRKGILPERFKTLDEPREEDFGMQDIEVTFIETDGDLLSELVPRSGQPLLPEDQDPPKGPGELDDWVP